jgi:hypothetical protein
MGSLQDVWRRSAAWTAPLLPRPPPRPGARLEKVVFSRTGISARKRAEPSLLHDSERLAPVAQTVAVLDVEPALILRDPKTK